MKKRIKRAAAKAAATPATLPTPEVVYVVEHVESEAGWGTKTDGYALYTQLAACLTGARRDANQASADGLYLGPEQPLAYFEIPWTEVPEAARAGLLEKGETYVDRRDFNPRFRSGPTRISAKP